ncbi:MAG: CBS domain-containing protein [candidate division KSB1 bacterium]|nr:CBS domain-containing protein [candidate division KSB1 bacterium]MDZ7364568.1 CBS domain-containing protein [candidate division KSB1 bacterium]MDZ7402684.1 CBS domain-containing protein [candidate division KSB1 bacterium]
MNKVKRLLEVKDRQVWTISKSATVLDALKLMAEKNIGALPVVEGEALIGIFTERDYARKLGLQGKQAEAIRIEEVMTRELITVTPDQSVNDCMALMTEKRIRHLPVLEGGRLVGLVSIGDVVKDIIEELEFFVQQLQNYITGLR